MRGAVALALVVLAASPSAPEASAGPAEIEADAQVVARFAPSELGVLFTRLAAMSSVNGLLASLARQGARRVAGWDPMTPGQWSVRGVDPARPIWISVSVDGRRAAPRYRALAGASSWSAAALEGTGTALWRVRIVLPIADRALAERTLLASGPVRWTRERWWEALGARRRPGRSDIVAVGWLAPLSAHLVARRSRGALVIDVLRPLFAEALAEARLAVPARDLLAAARRPRRAASMARSLPAAWPEDGGVALWLGGAALPALGRAVQQELHLAFHHANPDMRGSGAWNPNPRCASLAEVTRGALFTDASLRVAPRPVGIALEAVLGASSAEALAAALPRASSGLSAHRIRGAVAWALLSNGPTAGLRSIERPAVMSQWPELLAHLRGCEEHYAATARIFGWPQIAGLFFDELAALGPRGALLVESGGGAAGAVRRWDADPLAIDAALEGAIEPSAARAVTELFDLAFLPGDRAQPVERWGRGPMRPYVRRGGARTAVGITLGGEGGARWFHRGELGARPRWLSGEELAAGWLDLEASLPALRRWLPALGFLQGASELRARVERRGRRLVGRFDLML